VVSDQCGPQGDFAVSETCGAVSMTLGITSGPACPGGLCSPFDQTYLGPLADGESDTIVAGPPPALAVPALSAWFLAGAGLGLAGMGLLVADRARNRRAPGRAAGPG
jgi:hypothetical protein